MAYTDKLSDLDFALHYIRSPDIELCIEKLSIARMLAFTQANIRNEKRVVFSTTDVEVLRMWFEQKVFDCLVRPPIDDSTHLNFLLSIEFLEDALKEQPTKRQDEKDLLVILKAFAGLIQSKIWAETDSEKIKIESLIERSYDVFDKMRSGRSIWKDFPPMSEKEAYVAEMRRFKNYLNPET